MAKNIELEGYKIELAGSNPPGQFKMLKFDGQLLMKMKSGGLCHEHK